MCPQTRTPAPSHFPRKPWPGRVFGNSGPAPPHTPASPRLSPPPGLPPRPLRPGRAGPLTWARREAHGQQGSAPGPAGARVAPTRGDFVRLPPSPAENTERARPTPRRPRSPRCAPGPPRSGLPRAERWAAPATRLHLAASPPRAIPRCRRPPAAPVAWAQPSAHGDRREVSPRRVGRSHACRGHYRTDAGWS